jgi:hypothetical protein
MELNSQMLGIDDALLSHFRTNNMLVVHIIILPLKWYHFLYLIRLVQLFMQCRPLETENHNKNFPNSFN